MSRIIRRRRLTIYRVTVLDEHRIVLLGRKTALVVHTHPECPSASLEPLEPVEQTIQWYQQAGKRLPTVTVAEIEGATAF
jgi:hypothetical protein